MSERALLSLCIEGVLDECVVGHLLWAALPRDEQLACDGVVPGLQVLHATRLACGRLQAA